MLRRLFNVTSALSLLLCAATVVLWVRSYIASDRIELTFRDHRYAFESERGCIYVPLYDAGARSSEGVELFLCAPYKPGAGEGWGNIPHARWAGVQVFDHGHFLMVSYWIPALTMATVALLWKSRLKPPACEGRKACRSCGYDLRATHDRCPECGTHVTTKAGIP